MVAEISTDLIIEASSTLNKPSTPMVEASAFIEEALPPPKQFENHLIDTSLDSSGLGDTSLSIIWDSGIDRLPPSNISQSPILE